MSAYIVSNRTINFLVSWASIRKVTYWHGELRRGVQEREQEVSQILFDANVASVNHRYPEPATAAQAGAQQAPEPFTFRWCLTGAPGKSDALTAYGCARCLNYQACEPDNWSDTEACAIIDAIRDEAVRATMPESPWGLDEDEQAYRAIPLTSLIRKRA